MPKTGHAKLLNVTKYVSSLIIFIFRNSFLLLGQIKLDWLKILFIPNIKKGIRK